MKRTKRKSSLRAGKAAKLVSVSVIPITAYFKRKTSPNKPLQATASKYHPSPSKLSSTFSVNTDSRKTATTLQPNVAPREVEHSTTEKPVTPTSLGLDSLKITEVKSHSSLTDKSPKRCTSDSEDEKVIDLTCVDIEMVTPSPKKLCMIDLTESPFIIVDSSQEHPSPDNHTVNMENIKVGNKCMLDGYQVKNEVDTELAECDSVEITTERGVKMDNQLTMKINDGLMKCEQGPDIVNEVHGEKARIVYSVDTTMEIGESQAESDHNGEFKVKVQKGIREAEKCCTDVVASETKAEHGQFDEIKENCVQPTQFVDTHNSPSATLHSSSAPASLEGEFYDTESPIDIVPEINQTIAPPQLKKSTPSQPCESLYISGQSQSNSSCPPSSSDSVSKKCVPPPSACAKKVLFSTPNVCSARDSDTGDDISVYDIYKTPLLPVIANKTVCRTELNQPLCSTSTHSDPGPLASTMMAKCTPVLEKGWWSSVMDLGEVSSSRQLLEEVEMLLRQREIFNVVRNPGSKVKLFGSVQRSVVMNLMELGFRSLSNKVHFMIEFLIMATSPLTMPDSEVLVGVWDIIIDPHVTNNTLTPDVLKECLTWFHRLLILHTPGQHSLVDTQYSQFLRAIGGDGGTFGLWEIIASLHNGPRYHTQLLSFLVDLLLLDARNAIANNRIEESLFVWVFWLCTGDHHLTSPTRKLIDYIALLLQNFTFTDLDFSKLDNLMSLLFLAALRCSDLKTELLLVCQKLPKSTLSLFISHLQPQFLCDQLINEVPLLKEMFTKFSELELHDGCIEQKSCTDVNVHVAKENKLTQLPVVGCSSAVERDPQAKKNYSESEQKCEQVPQNATATSSLQYPPTEEASSAKLTHTVSNSSSEPLNRAMPCIQQKKREVKDISEALINSPPKASCTTKQDTYTKPSSLKVADTKAMPIVSRNKPVLPSSSKPLSKFIATRSARSSATMIKSSAGHASQQAKKKTMNHTNVKTQRGGGRMLKTNTGGSKKSRKVGGHTCENCSNGRCAHCRQAKTAIAARNPWK